MSTYRKFEVMLCDYKSWPLRGRTADRFTRWFSRPRCYVGGFVDLVARGVAALVLSYAPVVLAQPNVEAPVKTGESTTAEVSSTNTPEVPVVSSDHDHGWDPQASGATVVEVAVPNIRVEVPTANSPGGSTSVASPTAASSSDTTGKTGTSSKPPKRRRPRTAPRREKRKEVVAKVKQARDLAKQEPHREFRGWIRSHTALSVLSEAADRSNLSITLAYGLQGGYRWGKLGVAMEVEHNLWVANEFEQKLTQGALNIGVGGEFTYFEGRARTSLVMGPSVLLTRTLLDEPGEVGFYLSVRPVGFHLPLTDRLSLVLDPLYVSFVAPVVTGLPLVMVQYRNGISLEGRF